MQAIKLTARIGGDHRLELELPPDTPEGEAEIIVLVTPDAGDADARRRKHLEALLPDVRSSPRLRSKEEIDRHLAEERASWER